MAFRKKGVKLIGRRTLARPGFGMKTVFAIVSLLLLLEVYMQHSVYFQPPYIFTITIYEADMSRKPFPVYFFRLGNSRNATSPENVK